MPLVRQGLGGLDVVLGYLVADAARTGVEEQPHVMVLVLADLDEMVARTEGAELETPVRRIRIRVEAKAFGKRFQGDHTFDRAGCELTIVFAGAQRNVLFDTLPNHTAILRQLIRAELGADGYHAAADIHSDGGGDDRVLGGDDAAHGGALAQVCVGHQRHVREDERQLGGELCLFHGVLVDVGREVDQPVVDLFHAHLVSPLISVWMRWYDLLFVYRVSALRNKGRSSGRYAVFWLESILTV